MVEFEAIVMPDVWVSAPAAKFKLVLTVTALFHVYEPPGATVENVRLFNWLPAPINGTDPE